MTSDPLAEALEEAFERCRSMDASLGERLAAFADAVRSLKPSFAAAVDRLVERLEETGAGAAAPRPGERMPEFVLPDDEGRLVALVELLSEGPVAVAFHRGHWCPYCRLNSDALAAAQREVGRDGGQIVAITPDRQQFAAGLKSETVRPIRVLTDMDNGYALSLNLAIWVGQEMKRLIADAGWDLATYQGNNTWTLPIPATFVVAQDGKIIERYIDPDYRKRMAIEDLLKALNKARQAA